MASRFQQQSLQRKFVYFGLVVALFSVSLLHRKLLINAQAEELRLRQVDQGDPEVTDAALRLSLSGMRGLAVTSLWLAAIEKQKKHEWSELEVLVNSLTKLQPHYISPWLFQSWNLAFNVSVECDRTRDKYFYITRGIDLLAQGERKNKGNEHPDERLRSPAHPEMRYYMGFTYQLKVGQGDEKRTLRCLFDLSCIEPTRRDASKLRAKGGGGRAVDLNQFKLFVEDHPRLVRRLREQLGMDPEAVVDFLEDNRDVPSRFEKPPPGGDPAKPLPPNEQFPIVPPWTPGKAGVWPNPTEPNFGGVEPDVFAVTRAWYEYAQEPLPPPTGKAGDQNEPKAEPGKHRLPRMSQYIFRTYPARAQAYVGENLEQEGWFAGEGWDVSDWFRPLLLDSPDPELIVGKRSRFPGLDAVRAWEKAYDLYKDFGIKNALYLTPEERKKLELDRIRLGVDSPAGRKLNWIDSYIQMTNYTDFMDQTFAEKDPMTAEARRKFYEAERLRQGNKIRALEVYEQAIHDWIDVLLRHEAFGKQGLVQEDTYEQQMTYMQEWRKQREREVESLWLAFSSAGIWPHSAEPPGRDAHRLAKALAALGVAPAGAAAAPAAAAALTATDLESTLSRPVGVADALIRYARTSGARDSKGSVPLKKVVGLLNLRGPFEITYVYTGPRPQVRQAVLAGMAQAALWPPAPLWLPPAADGTPRGLLDDRQQRRLLLETRRQPDPGQWRPLVDESVVQQVRDRLGITQLVSPPPPANATEGQQPAPTPPGMTPPGR